MNNWLVATYKTNEIEIMIRNLENQRFDYFLPKITNKKINSMPKEELLFPGYIFVNTDLNNYSALRYTKGIKNIIKFGDRIPCISNDEIASIKKFENLSKLNPIRKQVKIGHKAIIKEGSFEGMIVKICSLQPNERVCVLLNILGSVRKVIIPEKNLVF